MIARVLTFLVCSAALLGAAPPNIVLIVADDLGYGDLACYGSKINPTPHIDALTATGVRFTDFHSAGPMCTPTRAAMLTGQYQQRFGRQFDGALGEAQHDQGLPHEAVTLAEVLKPAGYATACFGKWHLGYQPPWLPPDQGFDEFRGLGSGDGDFHTHIDRAGREDWWHGNELEMEGGYTTELLTRHSIDFIEKNRDRPFFLYLPHLAIHFPWQGPDDPPHRQKGKDYSKDKWGIIPNPADVSPHIKAMIRALDDSVGRIVAALKDRQLDRNTLVIFTSDNGGYLSYAPNFRNISSNGPLRDQKGSIYEGGHRVPTIISWPGRIQPAITHEIAHSTDLLPTIAQITGTSQPVSATDGIDLSPLLFRGEPLPERMLFWRLGDKHAVRSGSWKLCINGKRTELFDLEHDVGETTNLAAQHPERVKQLRQAWEKWNADVNRSAAKYSQP
ncbi:MAG: sulfatase [Prosthecobacter sp.]